MSAAGLGQLAQALLVKSRQHDVALGILQESALRQGHRRTAVAADAKDRDDKALAVGGAGRGEGARAGAVGQQDQFTAFQSGLLDESVGLLDGALGVVADDRHHTGIERIDEIAHGIDVVGQRRGDEGIAGIADQCGLHVAAGCKDVIDLESGAGQARRLDVGGEHGRGKFDGQHACCLVAIQGQGLTLPGRAGQGKAGQQPDQGRQPDAAVA